MADTKLTALTADASPTTDDLVYTVDDVSGTPTSKKVTLANIKALMLATPTITGHPTVEGVTATGATGTGKIVFDTSPTIASPTFSTPSVGVATGTSWNGLTITSTTGTLTVTNGKTLSVSNSLTLAGTDGKTLTVSKNLTLDGTDGTTMTFPTTSATIARTDAANTFTGAQTMTSPVINGVTHTTGTAVSPGYIGMPIATSAAAAYEAVAGDAGKLILHPSTDNNARTFTIPGSASVAFALGTALTFQNAANSVTIAITTDSMQLMGTGTTGSRTLASAGIATAIKTEIGKWVISGNGLT